MEQKMGRTKRSGLVFGVGIVGRRLKRKLKDSNLQHVQIENGAVQFLSAVLEYLCAEVAELSGMSGYDKM